MKNILLTVLSIAFSFSIARAQENLQLGDHFLYCHMSGSGEWTAYAVSKDGLHYEDLLGGAAVFDPKEHARIEGGTRDAYICRSHDGKKFLMVTTDMCVAKSKKWDNYGIDLLTSDDLIHWQSVTFDFRKGASIFSDPQSPDPYKDYSTIRRVWAPQILWNADYRWPDGRKGGYFIYYSLLNDGHGPDGSITRGEDPYDRMYYSYADETFTTLTKPRLMFDWGYATIDADINFLKTDGLYHMMIKKEGGQPGIFTTTSKTLETGYPEPSGDDYVNFEGNKKCEGVSAFQIPGEKGWRIAYIQYSTNPKHYRICEADEHMQNFRNPQDISGVASPQHGSFMRITKEEYDRLKAWSGQKPKNKNQKPANVMEDVNNVVDNTPDSIAKALMARPAPGTTRKDGQPVLFLIGNSTMRNGTLGNGNNGQWGWGYFAHNFYDETKIAVENQALGGMSTRTFYNQLWPAVREALKPGDWVIISIGHNDGGPIDEGRARSVLKGVGEDSVNVVIKETGVHETVWTYGGYIRKYVAETRAKGAFPILMSLTPRNAYDEQGKIVRKPQGPWLEEVARQVDCPYIDLNEISGAKLDSYGEWKTNYHFTSADKIHTSKFGAELNARSAAEGIMACDHPSLVPLKAMMKNVELPVVDGFGPDGTKREKGKPVVFITGDSTVKNVDKDDDSMWGWGSVAETVFDTRKITIANCAQAGRSTRTFLNEGRWEKVYNSLQPGDFVTIQFGHNDIGDIEKGKKRGTIACAQDTCHTYCLEGSGMYEVVYSFGWYLKKFIQDVREKGATPILVSLTPRNIWKDGKVERRNDTYGKWYREVVEETGVDFVDVHNLTADYLDKKYNSKEKPQAEFYKQDHTHTAKTGALQNAKSFAKGLKKTKCKLKKYLR